jgi:NADH-quinone oxidoreductase subunit L
MTYSGDYRGAVVEGIETSEPEHGGHHLIPDQRHLDQGDEHTDKAHGHHVHSHDPHESPLVMTGVLMVLAVLAIIGGFVGLPKLLMGAHPTWFQQWLEPVLPSLGGEHFEFGEASASTEAILMLISVLVGLGGIALAWHFYKRDPMFALPKKISTRFSLVHRLLENKYYVDELYNATAIGGTLMFARAMSWIDKWIIDGLVNLVRHITVWPLGEGSSLFDKYVIDGLVNGVAWTAGKGSMALRRAQSGFVQNYAMVMGGGIVLLVVVYLFLKP